MTVARAPEAIFDLPYTSKQVREEMVDAVTTGIWGTTPPTSTTLFLWQLLRLHDRGQDHLAIVHDAIIRAGVDRTEGFARWPGVLLVSRLKASGLWEHLQSTPACQVGVTALPA
jgi:hypothetical protein